MVRVINALYCDDYYYHHSTMHYYVAHAHALCTRAVSRAVCNIVAVPCAKPCRLYGSMDMDHRLCLAILIKALALVCSIVEN